MRRALAMAALVLAVGAAVAGGRTRLEPVSVGPHELAREIRDRRAGLVVVDLRPPAAFALDALPTARNDLPAAVPAPGASAVLYGGDAARTSDVATALRVRGFHEVRVLAGGVAAWDAEVLTPRLPEDAASWTAAEAEVAALSAYFGGRPRTGGEAVAPPAAGRRRGC